MSRRVTTISTGPDGRVTVVTRRSGCGCGGIVTVLVALFVVVAPAYYAGQGNWPLGWAGAVLAYIVEGVIAVAGVVTSAQRRKVAKPEGQGTT